MANNAQDMPAGSGGLLRSLENMAITLVSIAHTRLEMLSTDLEEDREHLLALLILALAALFCLGVGMVLAAILLVVTFWDTHRLLVLSALAAVFLIAGISAWWLVICKLRKKPRLFTSSLAELLKDQTQLASRL